MVYVPTNIAAFASTRETSQEVAKAIFEVAAEGDEARLWSDPTDEEIQEVASLAFGYAEPDCNALHWGSVTLHRDEAAK